MFKRLLMIFLGTLLFLAGIVGLFIPVLPGIVFLFASAVCFSSVSPAANRWLHNNRRVRHWRNRWQRSTSLPLYKRIQLFFWLSAETVVGPPRRVE